MARHFDRPIVVDLAYGELMSSTAPEAVLTDVTYLLDAVDSRRVLTRNGPVHIRQAWSSVFWQLRLVAQAPSGRLIVGHPSTWGARRALVLADVGGHPGAVTLVPRAVLIARSHCDVTVHSCAVLETTHVPRDRVPGWLVHRMRRTLTGWTIERTEVLTPDGGERGVAAVIDDSVEAVFVDGAEPGEVDRAVDMVTDHTVAGRVVRVDRGLLLRHGWRSGLAADDDAMAPPPELSRRVAEPRARSAGVVIAAMVAVALVVAAVAVGVWWHRDDDAATDAASPMAPLPAVRAVTVGRTTLVVPAQWRQTDQLTPSGTTDDPSTLRTVFVATVDGRRLIVIQTEVRADSTAASVAASLRNRIRQRGDEVVSEFSASTRFAGRDVISYREAPASGSAIRWYVLVDHALQVSIGCQAGPAAEQVDVECERAVRSTVIAQR